MKIKVNGSTVDIPEGKPVRVCWKCKCKSRPGISCAIGWLKHGEQPGRIRLVHSAFQTYDRAEQEYPCAWDIFCGSIIDIKILKFA